MTKRLLTKQPTHRQILHTFHTRNGEIEVTWTLRNWTVGFWWFYTQKSRMLNRPRITPVEWMANHPGERLPRVSPKAETYHKIFTLLRAGVDLGPLEFVYRETI